MIRRLAAALAVAFLLAAPTSAGAQQDLHGGGGGRAPLLVPNTPQVSDTLRALDRLHRMGYRWTSAVGADKAIRSWQAANRLTVDGQVGAQTLASLGLVATASAPAVRTTPPPAPIIPAADSPAPAGDLCAEMSAYRQAAGLPDVFDAIGYRESRCRNTVTSSTGCCFGWLQLYLASSMRAPGYRDGVQACGVNSVDDIRGDSDAAKRGQMCVAKVMFDVSGLGPWQ
jgi:hypothetical protein